MKACFARPIRPPVRVWSCRRSKLLLPHHQSRSSFPRFQHAKRAGGWQSACSTEGSRQAWATGISPALQWLQPKGLILLHQGFKQPSKHASRQPIEHVLLKAACEKLYIPLQGKESRCCKPNSASLTCVCAVPCKHVRTNHSHVPPSNSGRATG